MSGLALICGASEGIGEAFTRQLAARGMSLVLVARRREPLEALAAELDVPTELVVTDLASPTVMEDLAAVLDRDIDVLVYNAAMSDISPILAQDPAVMDAIVAVNVTAPMRITRRVGARMAARGSGGIVLMSSLSALQGTAMVGTYAATKAFLITFGESLWEELRGSGVEVVVCVAGATSTPQFEAVTPVAKRSIAFPMGPEAVARAALAGLGRGPVVIPGAMNKAVHFFVRHVLGRRAAVRFFSSNTRKIYEGGA